ncbi:hypothetical protein ILT44_20710 [Microvirga sp. BT689]|uniref:hypothetical protein n=1 Tax=Microvirga arvi TaxID=2778731 RepID=UPI001951584B|nr:hypothetical protein [Microvirga arvi]MBM6582630.1 hypothetical protein [Microvirga arvi]
MKLGNQLGLLALCLAMLTQPAYAYLDPGTASLLLQGIIGGIAAAITVVSLYYNRVKAAFFRLFGKREESASK